MYCTSIWEDFFLQDIFFISGLESKILSFVQIYIGSLKRWLFYRLRLKPAIYPARDLLRMLYRERETDIGFIARLFACPLCLLLRPNGFRADRLSRMENWSIVLTSRRSQCDSCYRTDCKSRGIGREFLLCYLSFVSRLRCPFVVRASRRTKLLYSTFLILLL